MTCCKRAPRIASIIAWSEAPAVAMLCTWSTEIDFILALNGRYQSGSPSGWPGR
jgi:hypothetical protein